MKRKYTYTAPNSLSRSVKGQIKKHLPKIGKLVSVVATFSDSDWYKLTINGEDGRVILRGCSWGYSGEGCHATYDVLTELGVGYDAAKIVFSRGVSPLYETEKLRTYFMFKFNYDDIGCRRLGASLSIPDFKLKDIRWNTGRTYTANGQRIAARAIDGGVFMVDIDRGLSYFFPGITLIKDDVMNSYDSNAKADYAPPSIVANNYNDWNQLRSELEKFAEGAI